MSDNSVFEIFNECQKCGRKLTSDESRKRGYGSYCYGKVKAILAMKPLEGQITLPFEETEVAH